ncbi:ABC transporter ATP-binding protein [Jonesia quinghaiensis]|uniref:ABC transporter ATP-binding protein n=1 Tax=Jonesia quinghaiensis TaxID=262806 RepID=UPI0004069369|nr:ATP-binding cassette domain-containing protein [Jonesia quinghaiensis]
MTTLEAHNITFAYPGGSPILTTWSHTFTAGQTTAITGPSGRGKSTALYILGLLLTPTTGHVTLNGETLSNQPDHTRSWHRAHHFGFVFQNAELDPTRTLADNILESCHYRNENPATRHNHALHLMERYGVALPPHRRPGQISGGQAQRVALCRALIGDPLVVLADEPTGNLDAQSTTAVINGLKEHAATGRIVIISTHSPDVVARCDTHIDL